MAVIFPAEIQLNDELQTGDFLWQLPFVLSRWKRGSFEMFAATLDSAFRYDCETRDGHRSRQSRSRMRDDGFPA